ncbi:tRNA (adenosine(37)-N6)-dimethylallyltransferase MiaA [Streptococcus ovuberis]|uniref:tRNA dimethylallyltransferase n=1 Tax=Streptococcus ovuberis TaxID=1936207 RepID=A0A7X6MZG6_9STRE|nr:tRNA (adenosine(37)-N6)-dimethylallyltransferase MiaA [Streptococcus ovuberis]NKZ19432.1 tRNA (adenosine(37)-N6)-dimethylallyltransferase MiaA [Streptococcus ovuberis]
MKKKVIVVLGPTAVGKTALGIELAQRYGGEIISGDSQQVYRGLDIGTAKATSEEQAAAKHHLIDVREVTQTYSAYEFCQEAKQAIEVINCSGKIPLIVGGTGLYLQSLLEGYHLGGEVDQAQVLAYRALLEQESDVSLLALLEKESVQLEQFSRRRAIRALELAKFGKDLANEEPPYDYLLIGLTDERERLYDRINQRVDRMVEEGLLTEAEWLYRHHPTVQATRGIGYKELFPYFAGELSLQEALDQLKQNSRRFAKRQLTWFKNRMQVSFYEVGTADFKERVYRAVETFLTDEAREESHD